MSQGNGTGEDSFKISREMLAEMELPQVAMVAHGFLTAMAGDEDQPTYRRRTAARLATALHEKATEAREEGR